MATYGISFSRKYRDQGNYDEALDAADKNIVRDENDAEAHYDRGATLYCLGRYEEAVSAFVRALELDREENLLEEGVLDDELFETLRKWSTEAPGQARAILGRYRELLPSGNHVSDVAKWITHIESAPAAGQTP